MPLVPLLSVPNDRDCCKTQCELHSLHERHPRIPPSLHCFLLPSFPPTTPPLACRVAGSALLSNLHHWPEKHWARCWQPGLIPHRGWQIISQPLCAEWGQPASEPVQRDCRILNCVAGHETICLDQLCGNDARGNVGTTRSCCRMAGAAGQGWTSCGGATLLGLQHKVEKLVRVITAWTRVLWRCFYLTLKG